MIESPRPGSLTTLGAASPRAARGGVSRAAAVGPVRAAGRAASARSWRGGRGAWTGSACRCGRWPDAARADQLREGKQRRRGAALPGQAPRLAAAHPRTGAARASRPRTTWPAPPERPEPKQPATERSRPQTTRGRDRLVPTKATALSSACPLFLCPEAIQLYDYVARQHAAEVTAAPRTVGDSTSCHLIPDTIRQRISPDGSVDPPRSRAANGLTTRRHSTRTPQNAHHTAPAGADRLNRTHSRPPQPRTSARITHTATNA